MGKISEELLKTINILIDKKISSLPFCRIVDGKVVNKLESGYEVAVEGTIINVKEVGNGECYPNDIVKVYIPKNNIQNAYINVSENKITEKKDNTNSKIEEINNMLNTSLSYSSEPKLIGTWMGKPLYRRCFEIGTKKISATSWGILTTVNLNLNVIRLDGVRTNADNTTVYPLSYDGYRSTYEKDTGNINFYNSSSSAQTFYSFNIILEYTL